jgi:hypothetical protein
MYYESIAPFKCKFHANGYTEESGLINWLLRGWYRKVIILQHNVIRIRIKEYNDRFEVYGKSIEGKETIHFTFSSIRTIPDIEKNILRMF